MGADPNKPKSGNGSEQSLLFSEQADFAWSGPGAQEGRGSTLFTIGHSTRSAAELVSALNHYGVTQLADIRHFPSSRHNPQFNQGVLREALQQNGIEYLWLKELGGYREEGYLAYMATPSFASGIDKLQDLARGQPTACMCAEKNWYECHRRHVADVLAGHGWRIVHILDESHAELHLPETNRVEKE